MEHSCWVSEPRCQLPTYLELLHLDFSSLQFELKQENANFQRQNTSSPNSHNYSLSKVGQRYKIQHTSLPAELPSLIIQPLITLPVVTEVKYIHFGIAIDGLGECIVLLSEIELTALTKSLIAAQLTSGNLLSHYRSDQLCSISHQEPTQQGVG